MTLKTNLPPAALAALEEAAASLKCEAAILAAILEVESGSIRDESARLSARRFEPHVFRRITGGGAASHAGAARIDPEAAEAASSHGAAQIMGHHAQALGYASAQAMRAAFLEGGWEEQISAMRRYAEATGMGGPLRALSIPDVSEIYNGPSYARLGYHLKLSAAYARISGKAAARILRLGHSGEDVEQLQKDLEAAGYSVAADGIFGPKTEAAVRRLQSAKGLRSDGVVGALTWAALERAGFMEAVEEPPRRVDLELDRAMRHRGKIGAILAALATFREEAAAWADRLRLDLGEIAVRIWAALSNLSPEQWAILLIASVVLWPHVAPRARRLAGRLL